MFVYLLTNYGQVFSSNFSVQIIKHPTIIGIKNGCKEKTVKQLTKIDVRDLLVLNHPALPCDLNMMKHSYLVG